MASTNPVIQDIRDRLNIVDVISSYIPVKKAGANYKATCPFHNEKSASLMISASKQIWHCFGCGEGGDIFGFVMRYENLEFRDALKILADKAGVKLPVYNAVNDEQEKYRARLVKINEAVSKFYSQVLLKTSSAEAARYYLKNRGLKKETLEEWEIGYAPRESHSLEKFLHSKGVTEKEYLDSGVGAKNSRGEYYDRFFNRITFPIKNYSGETVGFTARVLDADAKTAKYINSPETPIYNKSKVIFGLHQAKTDIRRQDCAVIVEGNMDVISCRQAGFKNVVASSGTAFTQEQLATLSRLTKNLKFAFDTDQAGIAATKRALGLALELGFNVYIVKISAAKDPDEMVKSDPKSFAAAIESAPLYLDYFFEKAFQNFNPNSVEEKKKIAAELVPLLKQLTDPLESAHYIHQLARMLAVDEKTVYEMLNQKSGGMYPSAREQSKPAAKISAPQTEEVKNFRLVKPRSFYLDQKVLGYALLNEKSAAKAAAAIKLDDFQDPEIRAEYQNFLKNPNKTDLSEVAKMAQFVVESEYNQLDDSQAFEREYANVLTEFKNTSLKIKMKNLTVEMVLAEQRKDRLKLAHLNQEFLELSRELKSEG